MTKRTFLWLAMLQGLLTMAQNPGAVQLTMGQAEHLFFKNNFLLLARQYDITAAEAQILQAKLYPNPQVSVGLVGYDGENYRYLPLGADGQIATQVDQLILLGGKRKAKIELAKLDKQRAEADLADLTRNLQYELRESFYTLYHQQQLVDKYDVLLRELDTLIGRYEIQVGKGNIPLKDLVRLKSVYTKIANDKSEERQTLTQQRQKLNLLMGTGDDIVAVFPKSDADKIARSLLSYDDLLAKAMKRPDADLAKVELDSANQNLKLQKRNAIPDLTLSAGYNQRGDAYMHEVSLGIGFPIPLFDANKGNIRAARAQAQKSEGAIAYKQAEIKGDVRAAYENFQRSVEEYNRINKMVNQDFQTVFDGVDMNFRKGNVSMIEFADFIESYNDTQAEVERVKMQLALAAAQIDLVTGTQNF